ncbi:MAG: M48 family metalloprotease [Micavibrio sp.]
MTERLIEEDLLTKFSIADVSTPAGKRAHEFLHARARALAGKYINFDETPVTFMISDSDEPNGFYAPPPDPEYKPKRDSYETRRYIKNPLGTHVICLSRGLIAMVDNLDQLDFVMGHELTHLIMRLHAIKNNSKGEEEIADLHGVDLMYDAGADPKQALIFSQKLNAYSTKVKAEEKKKRKWRDKDKEEGINWSEILDVHMTDENRLSGIEAALTRLSHLIDDRKPSPIDKAVLDAPYTDPVDEFLKAHNYEGKSPLAQIKMLIDCIDHLAAPMPAPDYYQAQLAAFPDPIPRHDWETRDKVEKIQKQIADGYPDYYAGPIIDKRYQQKIAALADGIVAKVEIDRRWKGNPQKPAVINGKDLKIYLHDKAYKHIAAHGYPKAEDGNYRAAAGIMYTYFNALLETNSPRPRRNDDGKFAVEKGKLSQIEIEMLQAKAGIKAAQTAAEFMQHAGALNKLTYTLGEIQTISHGNHWSTDKFDNLSGLRDPGRWLSKEDSKIYNVVAPGSVIPWNNLVEIAEADASTKDAVTNILTQSGITDYRVTHNKPYVNMGHEQNYRVTETGHVSTDPIPEYELDFAVHHETVMQAYDYIRSYFGNETAMIDRACKAAIEMPVTEFDRYESTSERFNRHSLAQKQIYDFISLFNALPKTEKQSVWNDNDKVTALIPKHYQNANPVPGARKPESGHGDGFVYGFSTDLFSADNPIFQQHFGESFGTTLIAAKEAQQQKMFDTTIAILKKTTDLWRDAHPRMVALKEQEESMPRTWDVPEGEEREKLEAALAPVRKEWEFHHNREDQASTLVLNTLHSVFDDVRLYWYNLERLKPAQKKILAEIAVRDEDNVYLPILEVERYECHCDYLKILETQTARVIAGDYQLTELMQVVAQKYDYKPAKDKESLAAFVKTTSSNVYSRDHKTYAWYMHMFDVMKHLEKTPAIDVHSLAIAMVCIKPESRSSSNPDKIVRARHANYVKFIDESKITDLVARAVAFEENYAGLSCRELLATADSVVAMRDGIGTLSSNDDDSYSSFGRKKPKPAHPQDKFLKHLDENITSILKKAEAQALQNDNALEKIEDLYHIYRPVNERYSTDSKRSAYVNDIDKADNRKAALSQLSEYPSFWPQDALEHVKAFVFAKNTFLDDKAFENKLLDNIFDKVAALPAGRKKSDCLHILLDKNMSAPYPETRDRLFALYTADVAGKLGKDNKSEQYQKRFALYLKALEGGQEKDWDIGKQHGKDSLLVNMMSITDKYQLLRQVTDAILSQENTSQMAKEACTLKLDSDDMLRTYLYGIGVDYLTTEMDRDAEMANKFIEFLNSKGEQKNCEEISAHIDVKARKRYQGRDEKHLDTILKNTKPSNCQIFYENFWAAPLEARAVITARMLKGATKDDKNQTRSWEPVFDLVINNMIRPDDQSVDARYARDIMRSYIKSRSDYERVLIMSAMMVANRNIGNDAGNIGKALKLFLENMGPAEIKLGQAIASHPDTPENIKVELQHLKNAADIPARWTLYDWIKAENIPEKFWKEEHLGEIKGSASYYTSVELGEEEILRILRPEAREKATKGFRVISSTVDDLRTKEGKDGLSYGELTSSVEEMVIQAARMSEIETDHDKGQQQYEYAREIYHGVTIHSGKQAFPLKVMDWHARGQNWIIMEKAKGPTFNALSETTPAELVYKRQFAKGYVVFELQNILSGRKFDHDKHGAQLSIDLQTNLAGIYDTGAMALRDPTQEEQRMLGNIVHGVLKDAMKGNETFSSLACALSHKIEQLHDDGKDTQYLVEVKKGLLALGDFFNVLTAEDMKDILPAINLSKGTSKHVYQGITEGMSMFERAQLQTLLTMQAVQGNHEIVIECNSESSQPAVSVLNVEIAPTVKDKAGWLQDTFTKPEDDNKQRPDSASFVTAASGPTYTIH